MMNSRMFFVAALAAALSSAVSANELDEAVLHGETDKPRAIDYKPGETMTYTLSLRGAGRRFNPDPARIPREDEGLRLAWTPEAHLNFRWYVPWRRVSLYAGLEVGWEAFLFNKPEWVEEDLFDEEEEDVYGKQAVEVGAGAGVEVALSPAFSLRAGLRYHLDLWIDDEDLDYGTEVDSPNLSVEAQIVWNPPSLNFF